MKHMHRRQFVKALGVGALAAKFHSPSFASAAPQVAITMDDPHLDPAPKLSGVERNAKILEALRNHSDLRAALFVSGKNVDHEAGKRLLQTWNDAGHTIANHTYSHGYYHSEKLSFDQFAEDTQNGENIIKDFPQFKKLFRYPYLKEGNTAAKRDLMRAFLKEIGYRLGYVTIDASDWYVNQKLIERLKKEPEAAVTPYRDFYLQHIWERAIFYDSLARQVLKRQIKHTLLLHHNLLNALFLPDLLRMFETKGWKVIHADEAFKDAVFSATPNRLPAGESIIWALAKETKRFDKLLRYPAEDSAYEKAAMEKLGL
jgi:peptidoglycan/xylan/chitin deacetylase (PgdA/CDA1 family)